MPGPLILRIIGDASSYLRTAETTMAANTKLASSFGKVGVGANLSAKAQIAAAVRSREALTANIAALRAAGNAAGAGTAERAAAVTLAASAEAKLARSYGVTTFATAGLSRESKVAERDLTKFTRGVLSGSGAAGALGRSLAFASSGFIAFASGAVVIRSSIDAAEQLKKAQDSLAVAIEHTGGNLSKLTPQYAAVAKNAQQFGVSQTEATTGLARATVLTGDAAKAQRAYQEALVISKATGKDFNVVLTATAKGQAGITTSLRRYGVLVKTGEKGTAQFTQVMERFGGQAQANTTASDRFRAALTNTEAAIGEQLLPTFERASASLAAWLTKMNESGRLQKDVNGIVRVGTDVFRGLGDVIGVVDRVTGSFKHTLELLVGLKFASLVVGWANQLEILAAKWGAVTAAATTAGTAESAALGRGAVGRVGAGVAGAEVAGGAAGGAGLGAAVSRLLGRGGTSDVAARVGQYTKATETAGTTAVSAGSKIARLSSRLGELALIAASPQLIPKAFKQEDKARGFLAGNLGRPGAVLSDLLLPTSLKDFTGQSLVQDIFGGGSRNKPLPLFFNPQFVKFGGKFQPPFFPQLPGLPGASGPGQKQGPFGTALPIPVFKSFQLTVPEQLSQAQAGLTKSNVDDVAAARRVIARIRRLIDQGHLAGASLVQALQAEGSALSTLWSAEDAAAQKRAAAAQAAKQRIQQRLQDSIDPLRLEIALSRAEAFGKPILPHLRALLRAAEAALAKGLTGALEKQALDQIASLKQQIKDAQTTATVLFTAPAKLQLALAKDAALGRPETKDLLKLKAAILKFIATHKKNIQAEIDAYNQLAQVNQELGSTAQSALGLFKQASTRALTQGLGLTAAQRKALRARLSQRGPGGTVPGSGTGAFGFVIGDDGRPVVIHNHVHLDGKEIEHSTTRHQQRRRRRHGSQRRGPHAGAAPA